MNFDSIVWKNDGWTLVQEADAKKHVLEIMCYAESGTVTQVRIRHNDGEEAKGDVTLDGKKALPMSLDAFKDAFKNGTLNIK